MDNIHEYPYWRTHKTQILIITFLLALLLGLIALIAWYPSFGSFLSVRSTPVAETSPTATTTDRPSAEQIAYGLTDTRATTTPYGTLYFVSPSGQLGTTSPRFATDIFSLDIATDASAQLSTWGTVVDIALLANDELVVAAASATANSILPPSQLARYSDTTNTFTNLHEHSQPPVYHVSASADGTVVAATYFTGPTPPTSDTYFDLANWEIRLTDTTTGETTTYPQAAKAQLSTDGTRFAYLTEEGVRLHDRSTGESSLLSTNYQPLTLIDDFTLSPDAQYLVRTVPTLNAIAVYETATNSVTEIGRVASDSSWFANVVPDTTGQYYAVVERFPNATDTLKVQVRSYTSSQPMYEYEYRATPAEIDRITLTDWR